MKDIQVGDLISIKYLMENFDQLFLVTELRLSGNPMLVSVYGFDISNNTIDGVWFHVPLDEPLISYTENYPTEVFRDGIKIYPEA